MISYIPTKEPSPASPSMIRYAPQIPFPPYRFVAGLNPHPVASPLGHSYGQIEEDLPGLTLSNWASHSHYLYGMDLYNFAFFWEAHEALEGLWRKTVLKSTMYLFLQGIIQICGACLKYHLHQVKGVQKLGFAGMDKLSRVEKSGECHNGIYLGICLPGYLEALQLFFEPFLPERKPDGENLESLFKEPMAYPLLYLQLEGK